jgi:hypothetical protein
LALLSAVETLSAALLAAGTLRLPLVLLAAFDEERLDEVDDLAVEDTGSDAAAELDVLVLLDPRALLSVSLIDTSCWRLFTLTSWLMYSFGSLDAVGS